MKKLMFLISVVCISFSVAAQESLTLSLQQCREMALSASEDLQKASNASQQAELTKKIANYNHIPIFKLMLKNIKMYYMNYKKRRRF